MKPVKFWIESTIWNMQVKIEKDLYNLVIASSRKLDNLYLPMMSIMLIEDTKKDLRETSDK